MTTLEHLEAQNGKQRRPKRILIMAPFFQSEGAWIDDFCQRTDFDFKKSLYADGPQSWHERGPKTSIGEWLGYFRYAVHAMKWDADCIVTCFPQLALVVAAMLLIKSDRQTRLLAWNFNMGLSNRWKGKLAGLLLRRVDRFVVHARSEVHSYSKWLGIEEKKFRFVPLQKGDVAEMGPSPIAKPYIVSMGSANRDYLTLVEAMAGTGIKTVIISKKQVLEALPDRTEVVKLHGLTQLECDSILGNAVLNVVPIADTSTASGQVTFLNAMRMGIPTVATRCVGTVDYIQSEQTGILVAPGDVDSLRTAVVQLWQQEALRSRLGMAGAAYAETHFSDHAAGRHLAQAIDELLPD
jgi:glycosyltransferase involved in cell wall biosynthesis